MTERNYDMDAYELAEGAYDLHIHTSPSHFKRELDDFELVQEADKLGMAGVLIKNHYEPTGARAEIVNKYGGVKTKAYGGIVLNEPVGGLNPCAVESALRMGARIVWMPTRDSSNSLKYGDMPGDFFKRKGITVLNEDGKLKTEVYEIMDIVKEHHASLATGHLSAEEAILLCGEGIKRGTRMILTHPEWYRTRIPIDIQEKLGCLGVFIEKNWYNVVDGSVTKERLALHISRLPIGQVYLATDRGQADSKRPAKEFVRALASMRECGISKKILATAVRQVPYILMEN